MTDSTSSFSKFFFDFNRVTKAKRINTKKDENGPQGVLRKWIPLISLNLNTFNAWCQQKGHTS